MKTKKLDINEQELNLLHIGRHKALKGGFIYLSNLVYNSDFIVCTDKTRICFNISRKICFILWWVHGMYCL